MHVFISWSGDESKRIALALKEWLPCVLQHVDPWMSDRDITAGRKWEKEIASQLHETDFGICVITHSNIQSPWLNFEAGALAKLPESSLIPYMVGFERPELPAASPLFAFQAKLADEAGTRDLVRSINDASGQNKLSDDKLAKSFNAFWAALHEQLTHIPKAPSERPRSDAEKLDDLLTIVRGLAGDLTAVRGYVDGKAQEEQALKRASRSMDWTALLQVADLATKLPNDRSRDSTGDRDSPVAESDDEKDPPPPKEGT